MASDADTTLADIKNTVHEFVDQRDWSMYHSPKNLSMSLMIEAAELMEHFQWISGSESRTIDDERKLKVGEEISDVLCYLVGIANELEINLPSEFSRKLEINRTKYPVEEFRGRYGRDDPKPVKTDPTAH